MELLPILDRFTPMITQHNNSRPEMLNGSGIDDQLRDGLQGSIGRCNCRKVPGDRLNFARRDCQQSFPRPFRFESGWPLVQLG